MPKLLIMIHRNKSLIFRQPVKHLERSPYHGNWVKAPVKCRRTRSTTEWMDKESTRKKRPTQSPLRQPSLLRTYRTRPIIICMSRHSLPMERKVMTQMQSKRLPSDYRQSHTNIWGAGKINPHKELWNTKKLMYQTLNSVLWRPSRITASSSALWLRINAFTVINMIQ